MINKSTSISLIAIGSLLVLIGLLFYAFNIAGSIGMFVFGGISEVLGIVFLALHYKSKR